MDDRRKVILFAIMMSAFLLIYKAATCWMPGESYQLTETTRFLMILLAMIVAGCTISCHEWYRPVENNQVKLI
jgi:hypothetical protein